MFRDLLGSCALLEGSKIRFTTAFHPLAGVSVTRWFRMHFSVGRGKHQNR
jgi:hypothetical protein